MSSGAPPTRAATLPPFARRAERTLGRRLDLFAGGVVLMLVMAYVASAVAGS